MIIPAINYLAVALATISTMVVGFVWYTPKVFGNYWMKAAKVDPGPASSAVAPIVVTVVAFLIFGLVAAWVLWRFTSIDSLTALLATAPGGIAQMGAMPAGDVNDDRTGATSAISQRGIQ